MDEILNYTPEQENPQDKVASLAEAIKAKYPAPSSNPSTTPMGDAFAAPIRGLEGESRPMVSFTEYTVDADEIYTQLNDGTYEAKFDNYVTGTDNNQRLANEQTTGEKWSHGLTKFGGKVGTAVLGATAGSVTSLGQLISTGSLNAMYSDDFNMWLDDLNTKMDYRLPNYYTKQEQEKGFIGSLGTANFWANDFLGGLSFTIGTVVGEAIWAAATGGSSLATAGARTAARLGFRGFKTAAQLAKANSAASSITKQLLRSAQFSGKTTRQIGRTLEGANTLRFIYTSAGYEAGVEARSYMKEAEENFRHTFEQQNGRPPSAEEYAVFKEDLINSANTVFLTNSALVGASNLAVFGKMFDVATPFSGLSKAANKSLFGIGAKAGTREGKQVLEALNPTKLQKFAGKSYSFLKAPVVEGVWEEGMQAVTSHGAQSWLMSQYDPEATRKNIGIIEAAYEGMSHTYGTKEGWKEIGLGMLIGLAGGGIATKGKFNEISQARKTNEELIGQVNTYSAENLFEVFKAHNQITKATEDLQAAQENNDMLGQELALRKLMYTNARVNHRFGKKDAAEDFRAAMEGLDDATFEAMGLDPSATDFENQKQEKKKELYEQYKEIQTEYKQDRKTAEYLVGNDKIDGVENTEELIEAVTYNLTMGRKSDEIASQAFDLIKETIASDISSEFKMKFEGAVTVDAVLTRAHKNTRERFYYHRNKVKEARQKKQEAEERLRAAQVAPRKENVDINQQLNKIQNEILKYTEKEAQELELMNQIFSMAKSENPYNTKEDAFVTEEALLNTETQLKEGMEYINRLKDSNPTKYHSLRKLFSEFHRANYAFKQFNGAVQGFASEDLDIQKETNFLTKIFKGKPTNEFTKEFFTKQLESYRDLNNQVLQELGDAQIELQSRKSREIANKLRQKQDLTEEEQELYKFNKEAIDKDIQVLNVADKIVDKGQNFLAGEDLEFYNQNKEAVDAIVNEKEKGDKIEVPQEPQPEPKTLDEKIEAAIKNDGAVMEYIGDSTDKVMSKKPTKRDTERFEELSSNETPTQEEQAELDQLKEKLSMWRLADGSIVSGNISLADLIAAKEQLEQTPEKDNIKKELTEQETVQIGIVGEKEASATVDNVNFLQTYENTKVKVLSNKKDFIFSHLNIESIISLFPNQVQIKTPKGQKRVVTPELVNSHGKVEGTQFEINLGDSKVNITVSEKGRLVIPIEQFEKIQEKLGFKIIKPNLTKQTYFDVYTKVQPEGETAPTYVPRPSDFKLDTVSKGGVIVLEPQEIENLQSGEQLQFALNMDSSFNTNLKEKYKNAKTTKQKKAIIKEIEESVEVYVTTEEGRIVGVVKALPKKMRGGESEEKHLALRQAAAKAFVANPDSKEIIGLNSTVPITTILIGTPNLVLEETEEGLVPVNIPISDKALDLIEDYGYIEDGEIKTNKGKIDDVNTNFIKGLGKNEKVPIIIFKHGKHKIAYPVSLVSTKSPVLEEVNALMQTNLELGEVILKVNDILLKNGISPKEHNLMEALLVSEQEVNKVWGELGKYIESLEATPNVEEWLTASKDRVQEDAVISIDLTNRPIKSPKVMVEFASAEIGDETTIPETQEEGIETGEDIDFGTLSAQEEFDLTIPEEVGEGFPKITNEEIAAMGREKRAEKIKELQDQRDEALRALRGKEANAAMGQLELNHGTQFSTLNNEVRRLDFVEKIKNFARSKNDEVNYNRANAIINNVTKPQIDNIIDGYESIIRRIQNTKTLQHEINQIKNTPCS